MKKSALSQSLCYIPVLLIGLFMPFSQAAGAVLHVSPGGDDKNPGSEKAPFATIRHAAQAAKPGDTVLIGPGVYREHVLVKTSGTEKAPVIFKGSRGSKGEYLSIIEAPGTAVEKWTPAPEAGKDVWKTPLAKRPDVVMMDGSMIAYINARTMKLPPGKQKIPDVVDENVLWGKTFSGMDYFRLGVNTRVSHKLFRGRKELFWPVIKNVISGWRDGVLYVRFADGSTPRDHRFAVSYGVAFTLYNVSHLKFTDLHVRNSRIQFVLGGKSAHITVENSLLMHGNSRITVAPTVKNTTVRNCVLTAGFIRNDLFQLRSDNDMRGGVLYRIFKHIIGTGTSADCSVWDHGENTKILDNIILKGLIGIDAVGIGTEVAGNVIREMSSVGLCTGARSRGHYYGNIIMNCGIPLRIHTLRHERARREEYHYGNLFVQAPNAGGHGYVHCSSYMTRADGVNFEPFINKWGRKRYRYKKNPPAPVDAGKFYIYHNTFWGGSNRYIPIDFETLPLRFRMALPFFIVNNIFKDSGRLSTTDHELTAPNLLYSFPGDDPVKRSDPKVAQVNKVLDTKGAEKLWNKKALPGLPDLSLAPDSPANGAGIDISKPFVSGGKKYAPLPGFKPGYFKGKAPAPGALQQGESFEKFAAMHRKALESIRMLENLKK
ncbi:MAG: DUF1565 domain-containing protein [Lentisphaeria bacterium]|nr:DUF1565 domain-containing protein [Lentisphaeria bacterium]